MKNLFRSKCDPYVRPQTLKENDDALRAVHCRLDSRANGIVAAYSIEIDTPPRK